MKNILIFFTLCTIAFFAILDAINLMKELDKIASSRTPAQIEMRPVIRKEGGKSDNVKFNSNQNNNNEFMRNNIQHNFQDSINKMNSEQDKRLYRKQSH